MAHKLQLQKQQFWLFSLTNVKGGTKRRMKNTIRKDFAIIETDNLKKINQDTNYIVVSILS